MRPHHQKKTNPLFLPLAVGIAVVIAVASLGMDRLTSAVNKPDIPAQLAEMQFFAPNTPAPDFQVTTESGTTLHSSQMRGSVVLLNFWATWCGPCVEEMPALDRLQQKMTGFNFKVIPISQDRKSASDILAFYKKHHIEHLGVYQDKGMAAARAFNVRSLPATVLLNKDGTMIGRFGGATEWDHPDVVSFLKKYLD